jgi:hypothetical protein
MFGLDLEYLGSCENGGCRKLQYAQTAGARWVRIMLPWDQVEPNAPSSPALPETMGSKSGVHDYFFWNYIDGVVADALARGLQVYLQIYRAPSWANHNVYPNGVCDPSYSCVACPDGRFRQGIPPDPVALEDLAYNVATHFAGKVAYYGAWNEPNLACNFNPATSDYLGEYVRGIAQPIAFGVHSADSRAKVVGPEAALSACGIPSGCSGVDQWVGALWGSYYSLFDVFSVHSYRADSSEVRDEMDAVYKIIQGRIPIWLTETGFSGDDQAKQIQVMYQDNFNRRSWWPRTFYHGLVGNGDGAMDLLNPDYTLKQAFTVYQSLYQ